MTSTIASNDWLETLWSKSLTYVNENGNEHEAEDYSCRMNVDGKSRLAAFFRAKVDDFKIQYLGSISVSEPYCAYMEFLLPNERPVMECRLDPSSYSRFYWIIPPKDLILFKLTYS